MPPNLEDRLKEVATRLGKSYTAWKSNEKKKDSARKEFFKLASEKLAGSELAQEIVEIKAADEDQAVDLVAKKYPAWNIGAVQPHSKPGWFEVIIEENPDLLPYAIEEGGFRIKRIVSRGAPFIDDERLQQEDPELWEAVTYIPKPERSLHDLDDLDSETLARLQEYIYEGKPSTRLGPVTKVADE